MTIENQDTYRDADETDRAVAFDDMHPRCARCGVIVCRCSGSCGESADGFERDGVVFCGLVCADAFEHGTPDHVEEERTTPIPVVVGGVGYPSVKAWRKEVA